MVSAHSAAAAASAATAHYLQFRIQWASIALLYYDYALTFPSEVKFIWGRKFKFSTALYISCRYALIANVLYLIAIAGRIPKLERCVFQGDNCDSWYKFDGVISVLGRAAVIATLTGRTYAVDGCSRLILAVLGSLGLACIILDIMHVPGLNCVGGTTDAVEAAILSILMCLFEFLAAVLTIVRCAQECRVNGQWKFERGGFFALVSKQGLYYYCIISIFTTAAVVLNFRAPIGSFFQRVPNAFNLPLSCLLTARFLLQLREWQERDSISAGTNGEMAFGAEAGQEQTISALRVIDAALLDDFGDSYHSSAHPSWETESTGMYGLADTDGIIALDNLRSTVEEKDAAQCSDKV